MEMNENIKLLHGDCIELLPKIPDESIDAIITDPPYGYLKNQKLDIPFNEPIFFNEAKRVLKPSGFILIFGRGTAFYRWNTILADLGFVFKEEVIWNKVQTTSPVLPLSRVHETISIHCKGKGKINKVRVPYLDMKGHDIGAIKQDIKRLMSVFSNNKSLAAVMAYLETAESNYIEPISTKNNNMLFSKKVKRNNRVLCVFQGIQEGLKEKSIIRNDRQLIDTMSKNEISVRKSVLSGDRACNCMQAINEGFNEESTINFYNERYAAKHTIATSKHMKNADRDLLVMQAVTEGCVEKSIIQQTREHYTMQHPTQKPLRLMERLMALVTQESALVLDPFMGSASTGVACINTDRKFIGMELDDNYFSIAKARIENAIREKERSLFSEQGAAANA